MMGCPVSELQARMSSREFSEWIAFQSREPLGERRNDLNSGMVAQIIANANRGKKQRAFKLKDFLPEFWKEIKKQSAKSIKSMLKGLAGK